MAEPKTTGHGDKLGDNVANTAHTGVEGHGKAAFPPFQSETFASQLVSFAIAFVLLYVIVSRFALPRVGGIIAARQSVIDNDLEAAAKLQVDSDTALKDYETELANARARAQAIAGDVRDKLNAEQESARKALEDKLATQAGRSGIADCLNAANRDGQCSRDCGRRCDRHRRTADRHVADGRRRGVRARRRVEEVNAMFGLEAEFWVAVAFVILMAVLGYFGIHRTILKALDHRSERIKKDLADARRLKDEATKLLADYRARRETAVREADEIIAGAKADAERIAVEAKAKMEEFVARRTKSAEAKIAMAEAQALADVRAAAADAAVSAAATIMAQTVKGQTADDLIARGISEVSTKLN